MKYLYIIILTFVFFTFSCSNKQESNKDINPAAEGFNYSESDSIAIDLADSVMVAMGGRKAWDHTEIIQWNFFGARKHIWNKSTGDLRIIGIKDSFDIRMNIENNIGTVVYHNDTLTQPDSLKKYLTMGKEMWINDSYWLIMPFKLKDSGVTLRYSEKDTTSMGVLSETVELSFEEVGVTPENKYKVYIDPETFLVTQWDFYNSYQDSLPRFSTPWSNYKKYGEILLSESRGDNYEITEISVSDSLRILLRSL